MLFAEILVVGGPRRVSAVQVSSDDMSLDLKEELFERCQSNWKRVLRFLQMVEQSSSTVETP